MYLGGMIRVVGINAMGLDFTLTNILLLIASLCWMAVNHYLILREEQFLLPTLGESYRNYMKKVPRYISDSQAG